MPSNFTHFIEFSPKKSNHYNKLKIFNTCFCGNDYI